MPATAETTLFFTFSTLRRQTFYRC